MTEKSINFDRAVDYYDQTRGFPDEHIAAIGQFMRDAGGLKPTDRVLEIGIGTGRIALPLAPYVGSITGVDISRKMMQKLRAKHTTGSIHLIEGDASQLPFPDGYFDAIVVVHVFHLVGQPDAVVDGLARVLKPDGKLLHGHNRSENPSDPLIQAWESLRPNSSHNPKWRYAQTILPERGWQPIGEQRYSYDLTMRPQDLINRLEQRVMSSTWEMSDVQLAAAVAMLKATIDKHYYGNTQIEVKQAHAFRVEVYQAPQA